MLQWIVAGRLLQGCSYLKGEASLGRVRVHSRLGATMRGATRLAEAAEGSTSAAGTPRARLELLDGAGSRIETTDPSSPQQRQWASPGALGRRRLDGATWSAWAETAALAETATPPDM